METKSYTFHVQGMHCNACVLLTESELADVPGVSRAVSRLDARTVEVTGAFGDKPAADVAAELSAVLEKHGYRLSVEKPKAKRSWGEFKTAVPAALLVLLAFVALQKAGVVRLIGGGEMTWGTAFVVGVVASLSSCMAVVGGLVLSLSASFAKAGDRARPHVLFHLGRLGTFFLLGGALGALGSAVRLNPTASSVLGLVVAFVMIALGLNLLDVFDWASALQPAMPKFLSARAFSLSRMEGALAPLLAGVATFFLPCGFTQSMQLYALTTKTFASGAAAMLAFALGTLPVLALISFGSFRVETSAKRGVFFKAAGLIVLAFALFNLLSGLAALGLVPPLFNL